MRDFSNIIILLSRQRSGTNALRTVLKSHPDIFAMPEVFDNPKSGWWTMNTDKGRVPAEEMSFHYFKAKYSEGRLLEVLRADTDERLFIDYLEYLRCFTDRKYLLIDIKYSSAHHISRAWQPLVGEPYLFELIRKYQFRVFNLRRKNLLRFQVSEKIAQRSQQWVQDDEAVVGRESWFQPGKQKKVDNSPISLDPGQVMHGLETCAGEDDLVTSSLASSTNFLTFDYTDLFEYIGAPISARVLEGLANWLEIPQAFKRPRPTVKKVATLPLNEIIANYDEIEALLRGTPYEYCLTDEPLNSAKIPDEVLAEAEAAAAVSGSAAAAK